MALRDEIAGIPWLHSHEEDEGESMVLRPSSFSFPPSRGRYGFTLSRNGTALLTGPAATDRHSENKGTWHLDDANRIVIEGPENQRQVFEITSAGPEKLVVKPGG